MLETLFIDRYPLRSKPDKFGGIQFDPIIQLVITHDKVTQLNKRLRASVYDWAFDTCYTGELLTSSGFLKSQYELVTPKVLDRIPQGRESTYLKPNGHSTHTAQGFGVAERVPNYRANAWVISNLPKFKERPLRLPLSVGVSAQPARNRHLIGRHLFLNSGLKIAIDFEEESPSLSMWVPNGLLSTYVVG